jgi:fibronectin-binding autotransporter adhesin
MSDSKHGPVFRHVSASLLAAAVIALAPPQAIAQTNGTWTNVSGGTWNVSGNWSGGAIASGAGATADFSTLDITGTQTVTLDSAYTLGSLSFADTSTSSSGSWVISNGGTPANTLTLNAGAGTPTITVSSMGGGSATIGANLVGSQGFTLNAADTVNPGTLELSGTSSVSGTIAIAAGSLLLSNTSPTAYSAGTFELANGTTLRVQANNQAFNRPVVLTGGTATFGTTNVGTNTTTRITFSNVISGTGNLTIDSTIGFENAANNTYSGDTTITPTGWLLLRTLGTGSSGAPTAGPFGTGTVTLNGGGMRQYNGHTATIYNAVNVAADTSIGQGGSAPDITNFAGPMTLMGGTRTFTVAGSFMQYSGPGIGDGGNGYGLTKAGIGLLMLGGSNTYTGPTTLTAGTLQIDSELALANSTFTHSGTGTLAFNSTVSGNAFSFGGLAASSGAATLALENNAGTPAAITLTVGGNNATTSYAGSLTGAGSVVKVGTGILSLSGSNDYAGTMTVNGGVLSVSSASSLPGWGTAGRVAVGAAGSLAVGNDMTLQQALDAGYLAATSGVGFDTTAGDRSVSAVITGSRPFVKTGDNVLTLTGASTFAGPTTLAGGTVELGVAQDGGTSGPLGASGEITFAGGGLRYSAANQADYSSRFSTAAEQVYAVDTNGQDVTWAADLVSSGGSLVKTGAGRLSLAGSNSYAGSTTLSGGTLELANANALAGTDTITFSGGTLRYTAAASAADISGKIAGSGSAISVDTNGQDVDFAGNIAATNAGGLTKSGAGTLTLSGSNAYTGTTTVAGGTLEIAVAAALPAATFTLDGGTIVNATGTGSFGAGGVGAISLGPGGGVLLSDTRLDMNGVISGPSPTASLTYGRVNSVGVDFVVINGTNTYEGGTILQSSGLLVVVNNNSAFGTGTLELAGARIRSRAGLPRTLTNAVTISANTPFNAGVNDPNLTFTGPVTLTGGDRTLQVDNVLSSGDSGVIFTNAIGDGGNGYGITKTGAGVLEFGGANTFSGATTVSAGTLRLTDAAAVGDSSGLSLASGASLDLSALGSGLTLGTGQSLGGAGSILGDLVFGAGSKLVFSTTDTLAMSGGTASFFVGTPGSRFGIDDLVGISSSTPTGTYTLISGTVDTTNLDNLGSTNAQDLGGGVSAYFESGSLNVVVVPEPSGWLLAGLGLAAGGWAARRRLIPRGR